MSVDDPRCAPPSCVRPIGHRGDCRATYRDYPVCGARMPYIDETCARRAGHRWEHRSRFAMDNAMRLGGRADLPFTTATTS